MLVDDVAQGLDVINAYAAEHTEIQTADAAADAARVRNAGAVFVGPWAPVSLGDYCAGSNHVLPTAGCACHSSGLSVRSFLRAVHVVEYSRDALAEVAGHVVTLADAEDLPGHGAGGQRALRPPVSADVTREPETWPPLREDLRGVEPYGAPQLDVPVALNVNENPYPPSQAVVDDIAAAVAAGRPDAEPLPRPRVHRAAQAVWRRTSTPDAGFPVDPRADLGGERLQRGDAADPAGLRWSRADGGLVRADVLDVSGVRPRRDDHLGRRTTARGLQLRPRRGAAAGRGAPAERDPAAVAEQPDRHRAAARRDRRAVRADGPAGRGRRRGDRRGVRRVPPRRDPSALELLPQHRNLIVTRTMSKAFALAGARLGYLAAAPELCDALRVVRLPYHLSAVTQAVAGAALRHADELLGRVEQLRAERDRTVTWLVAQGLEVAQSDANFVLFGRFADRAGTLAGAARPRRADPHDRAGGLAAGVDRHDSGDDGVQGRPEERGTSCRTH